MTEKCPQMSTDGLLEHGLLPLCDEGVLAMRNNELSRVYEPGKGEGKKGEVDGSC